MAGDIMAMKYGVTNTNVSNDNYKNVNHFLFSHGICYCKYRVLTDAKALTDMLTYGDYAELLHNLMYNHYYNNYTKQL